MESSIAEFLKRQSACELLPTVWQMNICVNDMRVNHERLLALLPLLVIL